MNIAYTPQFVRMFRRLEHALKEEAIEKIELFTEDPTHSQLKAHKLKGKLKNRYSFSVNYQIRIIYTPISKNEVALLAIGDHDVYK
ncbi:type II toxin-antitoxin system mRNA interferase toxin, RelE/StbE family [Candidatus Kaiserbacteria bacterium]|nr:MAG: type II toxin-antitoxin system mRNA interferase toxin, RelE/StbE family [Candidatus Kaiserbacteria bacterium]